MIAKEKTEYSSSDHKWIVAGERAEKQMAHYLKRAFGGARDVFVFNDLRLVDGVSGVDEACQIDHLVIHRYGMAIVESKSVSTEVRINAELEWDRKVGGRWRGMASPVLQAERQADLLREILDQNRLDLRDKFIGIRKHYDFVAMQVYVAISDDGRLSGSGRKKLPMVCKADQVCKSLEAAIKVLRKGSSLMGSLQSMANLEIDTPDRMSRDELERLQEFLLRRHEPLGAGRAGEYRLEFSDDAVDVPPPLPTPTGPPVLPPRRSTQGPEIQVGGFESVYPEAVSDSSVVDRAGPSPEDRCPKCGALLVVRTARKGQNAGNQFVGCSTFPMCRYTRKL